jgi:hypothetical protein
LNNKEKGQQKEESEEIVVSSAKATTSAAATNINKTNITGAGLVAVDDENCEQKEPVGQNTLDKTPVKEEELTVKKEVLSPSSSPFLQQASDANLDDVQSVKYMLLNLQTLVNSVADTC